MLVHGDKVLLQHRDNKPTIRYRDLWALPGGGCEPGETLEATAVREIQEETGYQLGMGELQVFCWMSDVWGNDIVVLCAQYDGAQGIECYEGQAFEFVSLEQMRGLKLEPGIYELVEEQLAAGVDQ